MKNRIRWICGSLIAFSLLGCDIASENPVTPGPKLKPGTLSLVRLDGLGKKTALQDSSPVLDLGEIKVTQDFYFLLSNSGDLPVDDITFSTESSGFTISPKRLTSLFPNDQVSVIPIIKVTAIHGRDINGLGSADLMTPGLNRSLIQVSGNTRDADSNPIEVSASMNIAVQALLFDVQIVHGMDTVDFRNPNLRSQPAPAGITMLKGFFYDPPAYLRNTGNVPVRIDYLDLNESPVTTLQPGDSLTLREDCHGTYCVLRLHADNVIADVTKFDLGHDGAYYLGLLRTINHPPPPEVKK